MITERMKAQGACIEPHALAKVLAEPLSAGRLERWPNGWLITTDPRQPALLIDSGWHVR
jgi:hypothetical protein